MSMGFSGGSGFGFRQPVDFNAVVNSSVKVFVQATAPTGTIPTGSIWIDTSSGNALYVYESGSWELQQFGTGAIQANSIGANQIIANSIGVGQLVAGLVYAGIVDGTTIEGAQFIAYSSSGSNTGVYVYSGTPGPGNGPVAWMSPDSTDPYGNVITPGVGATEGVIQGPVIASGTITATQIADATITALQIADATITAQQIADATITGNNIASATISGGNIESGTITGTNIASATIAGSNIESGTITGTNIASATIDGSNIASGTIAGTNIASATIDGSNIASGTITATNIADATITSAQISGTAGITGSQIAAGTITASNIENQTITATQIANETITASQIENLTITAGQIADATITGAQIADATIAGANIANATITNTQIASDTITGSNIESGTITGANIADATITGSLIENATITGSNLVDETITATQIASGTITATQIASETITASQIASNTITASQIESGIVLAGVVNGTTIEGAQFIAYGSSGEILIYSGTPALGNLIASFSGAAGTDTPGNSYSKGFNFGVWSSTTGDPENHFGIDASGNLYVANANDDTVIFVSTSDGALFLYNSTGTTLQAALASTAGTIGGTAYDAGLTLYGQAEQWKSGASFEVLNAFATAETNGSGSSEYIQFTVVGAQAATYNDSVGIYLASSPEGGPLGAQGGLVYFNTSQAQTTALTWGIGGILDANFAGADQTMTLQNTGNNIVAIDASSQQWDIQTLHLITTGAHSVTSTTLTTISGLSATLAAGTYRFRGIFFLNNSSNTSGGARIAINNSGAISVFQGMARMSWSSSLSLYGWSANGSDTYQFTTAAFPIANGTYYVEVDGVVEFTAAGTFNVQAAEATSGDSYSFAELSFIDIMPVD